MRTPIALFIYNRKDHLIETINSLLKNISINKFDLFIFSDGPKTSNDFEGVNEIRQYIKSIKIKNNFILIERDTNLGLANSIINGINFIFEKYDRVIVLEDDIVTSKNFLINIENMLKKYENDNKVGSVNCFSPPIKFPENYLYDFYFNLRPSSWGWGTWKRVWVKVDWETKLYSRFIKDKSKIKQFNRGGSDMSKMLKSQMLNKINSWSIIFDFNLFINEQISISTKANLVKNIGFDGSGTHKNLINGKKIQKIESSSLYTNFPKYIKVDKDIEKSFYEFFSPSTLKKILYKTRSLFF